MISTYAHETQPKPSKAFYEGRANAVLLCEEVEETLSEEIRYVDGTSLCCTVHKYLIT